MCAGIIARKMISDCVKIECYAVIVRGLIDVFPLTIEENKYMCLKFGSVFGWLLDIGC